VYVRELPVDEFPLTELRPSLLQVRRLGTFEIVTVIELLTPPQKLSDHQQTAKRRSYLEKGISLVEIDLLRGGARVPITGLPDCDYCILIAQSEKDSAIAVWPIHLRQRLPVVPIPLRKPDRDVVLDIQALIGRAYDAAGYEDYIYERPIEPPLSDDDALWALAIVPDSEIF
jgi:hypothetical protein